MTITAKVICDSQPKTGTRITTLELEYPRFIHSEFMTHRMFSRNASSSRAIPIMKMIQAVIDNPAMPIHWGKNQAGMQAREQLEDRYQLQAQLLWKAARDSAVEHARTMMALGVHKQIVNRILEPFTHIKVIVTATDFANFFALRDHEDAQPEIRELARVMKAAMETSTPKSLGLGEWHLPYLDDEDLANINNHMAESSITRHKPNKWDVCIMACAVSAARCARVSYLTHDGERPTLEKDLELYRHLVNANPPHMSPCEHQASPNCYSKVDELDYPITPITHSNFRGWRQFRHLIKDESVPG